MAETVSDRDTAGDKGGNCCRLCWQSLLLVYNLVLLLAGCGLCGLAIWTLTEKGIFLYLMSVTIYRVTAWLLFSISLLAITISCLGWFSVWYNSHCLLAFYTLLLVLGFMFECTVGLLCFVQQDQIGQDIKSNLRSSFIEKYGVESEATWAVDQIQQKYQCCGVEIFSDWKMSQWKKNKPDMAVPDSCCKSSSEGCGRRDHPSNIPYTGCRHRFSHELASHLYLVCLASLSVGLLEVLGVVVATCLFSQMKTRNDRLRYSERAQEKQVQMENGFWRSQ